MKFSSDVEKYEIEVTASVIAWVGIWKTAFI